LVRADNRLLPDEQLAGSPGAFKKGGKLIVHQSKAGYVEVAGGEHRIRITGIGEKALEDIRHLKRRCIVEQRVAQPAHFLPPCMKMTGESRLSILAGLRQYITEREFLE
jgi:hypothetical protein